MKHKPLIILASASPRRKELLKKILKRFKVVPSEIKETEIKEKDPIQLALKVARAKAKEVGEKYPSSVIIAADTVVFLENEVFGKPRNREEAKAMLEKLSGKKHEVTTAVVIYKKEENRILEDYETSQVYFKPLSSEEIEKYLETEDYSDKAGSYAIQKIGERFVTRLEGDYENVVGLPVRRLKNLLQKFLNPECELLIQDMAFPRDWGVGIYSGIVIFVPGTVIGDKVRVKIKKKKKNYYFGKILEFKSPSPLRIEPSCPHFGTCGGCSLQNLDYQKQLELKENYLSRTLEKIGGIELKNFEKEKILPSPSIFYYRNKMEFAFGGKNDDLYLGLRRRLSPFEEVTNKTVPLKKCMIFSQKAEKIFPLFLNFAQKTGLPSYNPLTQEGFFRNLILREGKTTGELMLILSTKSGKTLDVETTFLKLQEEIAELKSLYWVENDRLADVVHLERKKFISGKKYIEERLDEFRFRIYPETFFQPNPLAAEVLYKRIVEEAKLMGAKKALGLYCGTGAIEIFLARAVETVIGVDSEPMNILAAEKNSKMNNIPNCRFVLGQVEKVVDPKIFADFDLLVLDPPRAGLSPRGMKRVLSLKIPNLMYVSCNPATLARDLRILLEKGYRLRKLLSFDFFPHTPHLETLGILTR